MSEPTPEPPEIVDDDPVTDRDDEAQGDDGGLPDHTAEDDA